MSSDVISAVSIDLGAINTGVYLFQMQHGLIGDADKRGLVVRLDPEKIMLSQVTRRAKRHQRRCYARRKLAKRLMRLLLEKEFAIPFDQLPDKTRAFLHGLLNRRGFTFLGFDEINVEEVNSIEPDFLAQLLPDFFVASGASPAEQLQMLTGDLARCSSLKIRVNEVLIRMKEKDHPVKALETPVRRGVERALKTLAGAVQSVLRSEKQGHHHRQEYFEHIIKDILTFQDVLAPLYGPGTLTPDTLFRLIGHISNLQLRILRKYFNDPAMKTGDTWDSTKFTALFRKYVRAWHARGDQTVAANRAQILKDLAGTGAVTLWLKIHPQATIPPYEDQNNRRPPICNTLLMNPQKLDANHPGWREATRGICGEEWAELASGDAGDALRLQRILDRTGKVDYFCIGQLAAGRDDTALKPGVFDARLSELGQKLGEKGLATILAITRAYRSERELAETGEWHQAIPGGVLTVCGKHPPRKAKQLDQILSMILRFRIGPAQVDEFKTFFGTAKFKGNSTCRSVAEKAARAQKEYGQNLKMFLIRADEPELQKLKEQVATAGAFLEKFVDDTLRPRSAGNDTPSCLADVFIFAQLYNLMYLDTAGFSSTCRTCTQENVWRNLKADDQGIANGRRLPADSVRPFDGILARSVELVARAVARAKVEQIRNLPVDTKDVLIPIAIEANSFEFASELSEMKKAQMRVPLNKDLEKRAGRQEELFQEKGVRIRRDGGEICPYTGDPIHGIGHLDHIVPRALTQKHYRAVFNSEVNLINCSVRGNNLKGDREFTLTHLADTYLKGIFNSTDRDFVRRRIEEGLRDILQRNSRLPAMDSLTQEERNCLRHALFVPELRRELMPELNQQNRTRVNGTQRFFLRILRKEIERGVRAVRPEIQPHFVCERIGSGVISVYRQLLAAGDPAFQKSYPQSAFSHVIDAAMLFVAQSASGFQRSAAIGQPPEDPEFVKGFLPTSLRIRNLVQKPGWRTAAWHQPLFKDSNYGFHFVPFLVTPSGTTGFGYDENHMATIKKKEADVFALLHPFFRVAGLDLNVAKTTAKTCNHTQVLTFHKDRVCQYLLKIAHQKVSNDELQAAAVLESLAYFSQKIDLGKALFEQDGLKLKSRDALLEEKRFQCTLQVPGGVVDKLKMTLPFRRSWELLLDQPFLKNVFGKKLDLDGREKLVQEIEQYFLTRKPLKPHEKRLRDRQHRKTRRVFSLPIVPDTGAIAAIRQETPMGHTWQFVGAERPYEGFDTAPGKFSDQVLLAALRRSSHVFFFGYRWKAQEAKARTAFMDEWRQLMIPKELVGLVEKLELMPGQATRRYLRLSMESRTFLEMVYPCLISAEATVSPLQLLPEYKLDKEKKVLFKSRFKQLGVPRTFVRLEETGSKVVFCYEAEGVSSDLANQYFAQEQ